MLFTERAFLSRFEAAAQLGFRGVEYVGPYDFPAAEIAARLDANGPTQALFNLPTGDRMKGERGLACLPGRVAEFRARVDKAVDYAHALGCRAVNRPAGIPAPEEPLRTLIESLRYDAGRLEHAGGPLVSSRSPRSTCPAFFSIAVQARCERSTRRTPPISSRSTTSTTATGGGRTSR